MAREKTGWLFRDLAFELRHSAHECMTVMMAFSFAQRGNLFSLAELGIYVISILPLLDGFPDMGISFFYLGHMMTTDVNRDLF